VRQKLTELAEVEHLNGVQHNHIKASHSITHGRYRYPTFKMFVTFEANPFRRCHRWAGGGPYRVFYP
jgi:hypothetical protein